MALIGNRFYVGNTDGIVVFPYRSGDTQIKRRPEKILDLPAGGHYTRNLLADPAGQENLRRGRFLDAMSMSSALTRKIRAERRYYKSIGMAAACAYSPAACATRSAWIGNRRRIPYGRSSTSATCSVTSSCPIISPRRATARSTAGPIPTSARTRIRARKDSARISSPKPSNRILL